MCGICGVVQVGGEPRDVLEPGVLDAMTDVMTHRGPDDRGTYVRPGIALGVRRLSIVDVEGGHQPFSNEDGRIWGIQNGELYNHLAIRAALKSEGHSFRSRCDTEILPHLYESTGASYPQRLRGKFGAAVWDARERRAVVARDRLGVKPMYWSQAGDLVVFASELKSLLASGLVPADLDYEAIDAYLTFGFVPGPLTPLEHVQKLMPGHVLIVDPKGVKVEQYWEYPKPVVDAPALSVDEYADGLVAGLEESVRLRLMSDVPLGAMLSGGLDSSLVVALMARNMSEPVKTFSVGFTDGGESSDFNELADARLVASEYGTDHHELELRFADTTIDLADLVWFMDEPLADLGSLGLFALSELASRHVTVALSGQGADELFGGYTKHRAASLLRYWQRLPHPAQRFGTSLARRGPRRFRRMAKTMAADGPVERLLAMSSKLDPAIRARLAQGPLWSASDAARDAVAQRAGSVNGDPLTATLYIDGQLALVDDMLHYFDRASMAHSLEVRVPFLDHELVEYSARIPPHLKVRGIKTKNVLKHAARPFLPESIVDKRKIGFFAAAVGGWFREQTRVQVKDYLLDNTMASSEFLDQAFVRELVWRQRGGEPYINELLLSILMLEVWLASFLPRALKCGERSPMPAVVHA
ncbi:MAG TPA: asparagine synthase (glutamine-hydrolyzing) [Gaiellaceae bacterium]|nr:asparagine synthase (glutamine-hydrolyzing) [Gaiellaceae bacterium]